jgi:hypothetical protein
MAKIEVDDEASVLLRAIEAPKAVEITGVRVLEGKKPVVVTATVTVPATSPLWGLSIATSVNPTGTPNPTTASSPTQPAVAKTTPRAVIRHAAAVLTGQDDVIASIATCFASDSARIKKQRLKEEEDSWVLESSEFALCTTGDEVLAKADEIVSRLNQILALYCNFTPPLSVDCISWISAEGEPLRTIRGSISVNITSSEGLSELKSLSGTQPLGSAVFEAMTRDRKVNEALTLHGDSGLSWSQVYDIIDLVGGVDGIVKARLAAKKQASAVRQTANHYRHQGLKKKPTLPANPPTLAQANKFARGLLKRWISLRV